MRQTFGHTREPGWRLHKGADPEWRAKEGGGEEKSERAKEYRVQSTPFSVKDVPLRRWSDDFGHEIVIITTRNEGCSELWGHIERIGTDGREACMQEKEC